ncbi:myb domain-containing protein [Nannochloropsis gaditana CCMP526]|uniref:myb domain-containing protein n=1 Tax=Nannochloropsis gaditana (strain CCMP526) TaxID=1093141 RepID=UPI00029F5E4B|nr:myb domain-containing protein [Nannochloropsis gaditana CCMP526]EKU23483.1 myb domain-containing protein [Nannochloropsis gaditana CCMP526]|eukprot:XP_005852344.1 myb domain-containing protein [Nannochloropsis gaditana CCMP526]
MKEDVEKGLPPKEETIIDVELTGVQKQYYRAIYEKNVEFLLGGRKAVDGPSLMNLCMELRKCCNHPFLNKGVELDIRSHAEATGKVYTSDADLLLVLLDKLLPRLQANGHRVLLFSQFKIMLDILEDYLEGRKFSFGRIDGTVTGEKRQQMDRWEWEKIRRTCVRQE